jgi:hypothetical protein
LSISFFADYWIIDIMPFIADDKGLYVRIMVSSGGAQPLEAPGGTRAFFY